MSDYIQPINYIPKSIQLFNISIKKNTITYYESKFRDIIKKKTQHVDNPHYLLMQLSCLCIK